MTAFVLCIILFLVGLYGVLVKRNLIKIIIGLCIMEYSLNLFLILIAYIKDSSAPIINDEVLAGPFVDPLPQAMVLTAIVIGLATTALLLAVAVRIYRNYGTFDINKINSLKG